MGRKPKEVEVDWKANTAGLGAEVGAVGEGSSQRGETARRSNLSATMYQTSKRTEDSLCAYLIGMPISITKKNQNS